MRRLRPARTTGTTTSVATSAARRRPVTVIVAPVRGGKAGTANQTTHRSHRQGPTCSFVAIAAAAQQCEGPTGALPSRCDHAKRRSGHASATGPQSFIGQPLHRRDRADSDVRAQQPAIPGSKVLACEPRRLGRVGGDGHRLHDEQKLGIGDTHQSGASAARIGSKCEPRREIWLPWTSVTERKLPCAVSRRPASCS